MSSDLFTWRDPVLVHSDAYELSKISGLLWPEYDLEPLKSRANFVGQVLHLIEEVAAVTRPGLLFPAFNYEFGRTGVFDVSEDPVQVGAIPETIRREKLMPRNAVPFFSFIGESVRQPNLKKRLRPFGKDSTFGDVIYRDGSIMMLGAGIRSVTMLHHIEEVLGPPLYRYEKTFGGLIRTEGREYECSVSMHVRPAGLDLEYDWKKIEQDMLGEGVLWQPVPGEPFFGVHARDLLEFVSNRVARDPLYLLDLRTANLLREMGLPNRSRLQISEFES